MNRRLAAILVLMFLLLQGLGIWFGSAGRLILHHELLDFEEEENLVFLKFSSNDPALARIEWMDEKEFRLDGKMYDLVLKLHNERGDFQLICFQDEKETEIRAAMQLANENGDVFASKDQTPSFIYLLPKKIAAFEGPNSIIDWKTDFPICKSLDLEIVVPPPQA